MNEVNYEKNVMCEIFPTLIDSMAVERLFFITPPPYYKNISKLDSLELAKSLKDFEKNIRSAKRDSSNLVFAINDSTYLIEKEDRESLEAHFKNIISKPYLVDSTSNYKLDFKSCKPNYKLKYTSEFPPKFQIWQGKYNFEFGGVITFSRIHFDTKKEYGVLTGSYICGGLCGNGYRIFIKKVKNKWVIDEIIETWIS